MPDLWFWKHLPVDTDVCVCVCAFIFSLCWETVRVWPCVSLKTSHNVFTQNKRRQTMWRVCDLPRFKYWRWENTWNYRSACSLINYGVACLCSGSAQRWDNDTLSSERGSRRTETRRWVWSGHVYRLRVGKKNSEEMSGSSSCLIIACNHNQ